MLLLLSTWNWWSNPEEAEHGSFCMFSLPVILLISAAGISVCPHKINSLRASWMNMYWAWRTNNMYCMHELFVMEMLLLKFEPWEHAALEVAWQSHKCWVYLQFSFSLPCCPGQWRCQFYPPQHCSGPAEDRGQSRDEACGHVWWSWASLHSCQALHDQARPQNETEQHLEEEPVALMSEE